MRCGLRRGLVPVLLPHHQALEVVSGWAAVGRPCEVAFRRLVTCLPVQLWVPQSHADVVQQAWQGP